MLTKSFSSSSSVGYRDIVGVEVSVELFKPIFFNSDKLYTDELVITVREIKTSIQWAERLTWLANAYSRRLFCGGF